MKKDNKPLKILLVSLGLALAFMIYQYYQIHQLNALLDNQQAIIAHIEHSHEQMLLALYNHLTFCEY